MRLEIVSWHGDTTIVHEGATYKAWLPDESTGHFSQVASNVTFLKKEGATPQFLSQTPNEWYFPLTIQIVGRTDALQSSGRDALAKLFPTTAERNFERTLIVQDIDDSNKHWQVTGTPFAFRYDRDFIRIIIAVAEPRWVETDEQSDSDSYTTGIGVLLSPEPKGNTEFDPILEIQLTSARTVIGSGEEIAHFVEITNPVGQPAVVGYAIELSDGGWNHAADVTADESLANGDDIRVELNGSTVNRWFSGLDTASAKLWTHVDLPQGNVMQIRNPMSSGGDEVEVLLQKTSTQHGRIHKMPNSGQFKIGTERFTYTGRHIDHTRDRYLFTGLKRGVLQSSKSGHNAGSNLTWIPNQIYVYQGKTSVADPPISDDAADFAPAFELISTNAKWIYDTVFSDQENKRSWGFSNNIIQLNPPADNIIVGESQVFTDNEDTFANPATVLGQKIGSVNDPYSNGNFKSVSVNISATLSIPHGIKDITVEGRKARVGTESIEKALWISRGQSDWTLKWDDTTAPASDAGVWENLKSGVEATLINLDNASGYKTIMFLMRGAISGGSSQTWEAWQIDKCTLDFNAAQIPVIVDGFSGFAGGTEVVQSQFTIINSATGDSIEVVATVEINDTIILDFQTFSFYVLSDNKALPVAIRPSGAITGHWFRLMGGEPNTLTITDANMSTTTMNVRWNARHI